MIALPPGMHSEAISPSGLSVSRASRAISGAWFLLAAKPLHQNAENSFRNLFCRGAAVFNCVIQTGDCDGPKDRQGCLFWVGLHV